MLNHQSKHFEPKHTSFMTPRETDIKDVMDFVRSIMGSIWHTLMTISIVIVKSSYGFLICS